MLPELKPQSRLHGTAIFLSASVPTPERAEEYNRIAEAPIRIEEAVMCLARAVFVEGGTLVCGAHPSISPLLARVVDDYFLPAPGEVAKNVENQEALESRWNNPSVVLYQSEVWRPYWSEITEQLSRHPLVRLHWMDADPGESIDLSITDRSQAPNSMGLMRNAMIENTAPAAMIAIGGMDGVIREAKMFATLRPGAPIFAFETTGGAAAVLARDPNLQDQVRVVDREAEALVRQFWQEQRPQGFAPEKDAGEFGKESPAADRKFYVPYAAVAQQIIADIIAGQDRGTNGLRPRQMF